MNGYKGNRSMKLALKASSSVSLIGCYGDTNSNGSIHLVDLCDT